MEEFIAGLPKAELHMHLEGSLTTSRLIELANKNNVKVPSLSEIEHNRSNYQTFDDFLLQYRANTEVIHTMQDLSLVLSDYLSTCAKENILYAEIHFCPIPYYKLGFSFEDVINTLDSASTEAFNTLGVRSNFILCIVKHLSQDDLMRTVQESQHHQDKIIGIGCAGTEIGKPAKDISHLYEEARRLGFKNFTAHSGEFGDPRCMIDTLYHLKVSRIDHGVRCLEDQFLMKFLRSSDIWLTVCPLSNYHLKVLETHFDGEHIVERLLDNQIKITINSDDPTLLGGFLNDNYLTVAKSFTNKSELEVKKVLAQLAKNSFLASFLENDLKAEYIQRLGEYLEKYGIILY